MLFGVRCVLFDVYLVCCVDWLVFVACWYSLCLPCVACGLLFVVCCVFVVCWMFVVVCCLTLVGDCCCLLLFVVMCCSLLFVVCYMRLSFIAFRLLFVARLSVVRCCPVFVDVGCMFVVCCLWCVWCCSMLFVCCLIVV